MTVQLSLTLLCCLFCVDTMVTSSINIGLSTITECLCPGYNVVYECTVTGGVFTVWGGSAFQCAGNEITLPNSEFGAVPPPAAGCNNGQIIGRGISQQNNCYTSQLNITLGEELIGRNVMCGIDDGQQLTTIDNIVLATPTRPLSPPKNISVNITSNSMTFTWDHISRNCPGLYYNITSINCGICPSGTDMPMISCSNFMVPTNCTLTIQTVTCWGTNVAVSGNSTLLSFFLKVPEAPDLTVIPYYSEDEQLIGIFTEFSKSQFMISESVDGSPIFYNITYTDFSGSTTCGFAKISANSASCNKSCSHYSTDICSSTDTMVTVFGTNVLGSGASNRTTVDARNGFVKTMFDFSSSPKKVSCIFREQTSNAMLTCRISIATGSGTNCQSLRGSGVGAANPTSREIVTINLNDLISNMDNGKFLCYNITASDGSKQVVVQDIVSVVIETDSTTGGIIASVVTVLFLCSVVVAVVVVALVIFMVLSSRSKARDVSDDCEPLLIEEGESLTMDECGKQLVGPNYDHSSGNGYYLADEHEQVPLTANVIARSEDGNQYKTGSGVHKKLIDTKGKILPSDRRGSKYESWSIFVQSRSKDKILHEGSVFLHCKVSINDGLQEEDTSTLPEGVVPLKKWYYMYDIPDDIALAHFCGIIDKKVPENEHQISNLFYEKHETEKGQATLPKSTGPNQVMALRTNNGKLFKDSSNKLYTDAEFIDTEYDNKVLRPSGWKHLFIPAVGDRVIRGGSKLLYCDQIRGPTLVCKPFEIYEVAADDKDKKISELLKSRPIVRFELKAGYIYMETEETIKPQDTLMALDKDGKLCTGEGVCHLLGDIDRERIWKSIFVQVKSDKSLEHCKRVLYCKT